MGRKRKKTFLIFTEGLSEQIYFQALSQLDFVRKSKFKLEVVNCQGLDKLCKTALAPTKREAKQMREAEKVAFIFDKDDLTRERFDRILATDYVIGYSAPQFEVWLLAHFEEVRDNYSDIMDSLSNYIPEYKKSSPQIPDLAKNYQKAIENLSGKNEAKFDEVCSSVESLLRRIE